MSVPPAPLTALPLPPQHAPGVDGGTESIRAGVFDLEGTPLSFASAPYLTSFPAPGWAEQAPADWWAGLGAAVQQAVSKAGVDPASVGAICVDTTCCTVVALDAEGQVGRPSGPRCRAPARQGCGRACSCSAWASLHAHQLTRGLASSLQLGPVCCRACKTPAVCAVCAVSRQRGSRAACAIAAAPRWAALWVVNRTLLAAWAPLVPQALRPALLWMDMRSAGQAARVAACGDDALAVNGAGAGPVSAEWMVPKALWLKVGQHPGPALPAVGGPAGRAGRAGGAGRVLWQMSQQPLAWDALTQLFTLAMSQQATQREALPAPAPWRPGERARGV